MSGRHQHRRPPVALSLRPRRVRDAKGAKTELAIKRGTPSRSIIGTVVVAGRVDGLTVIREHTLHATKGYRSTRIG